MKKFLAVFIGFLSLSCEKPSDMSNHQFLAKIVDYDLNCSTCILEFPYDSDYMAAKTGNSDMHLYHAINLNKYDFTPGQLIKVKFRNPGEDELRACITLYPAYDYYNIYVTDFEKYCDFDFNDTIDLCYNSCLTDYSNQTTFCFDSVLTDSRCPENLICIWAGEAIVRIRVLINSEPINIDLYTGTIDTVIGDYKVSLLDLIPYPNTDIERDIYDYKAKLIIKRKL